MAAVNTDGLRSLLVCGRCAVVTVRDIPDNDHAGIEYPCPEHGCPGRLQGLTLDLPDNRRLGEAFETAGAAAAAQYANGWDTTVVDELVEKILEELKDRGIA